MFSLFHPRTHNLSQCQKIQANVVISGRYVNLCGDLRPVCASRQKLGMILENKVVQKLKLDKNVVYKKWSPRLIFLND